MRSVVLAALAASLSMTGCASKPPEDLLLAPPPAGQGFQLAVEPFSIASGSEQQRCYFMAVPGNGDVWVDRFTVAANTGTHHVSVFRVKTIVGLSGQPGDVVVSENGKGPCFVSANWADWPLVVNSQEGGSTTDWQLPPGVGARFTGGELLMLQVHYVNATTQTTPGLGRVAVNMRTLAAAPPNEVGTLFATNQNIRVCPGDSGVTFETRCHAPLTGTTIIAANGHFHSRGVDFQIGLADATGGPAQMFYDSTQWADPTMALDLDVPVPAGSVIDWKCSFSADASTCGDPNDSCCFNFGGRVESQEHCNAFVYYYPKLADYNCF